MRSVECGGGHRREKCEECSHRAGHDLFTENHEAPVHRTNGLRTFQGARARGTFVFFLTSRSRRAPSSLCTPTGARRTRGTLTSRACRLPRDAGPGRPAGAAPGPTGHADKVVTGTEAIVIRYELGYEIRWIPRSRRGTAIFRFRLFIFNARTTRERDTFLTRHKNKTSDACARVRAPGPAGRGLGRPAQYDALQLRTLDDREGACACHLVCM